MSEKSANASTVAKSLRARLQALEDEAIDRTAFGKSSDVDWEWFFSQPNVKDLVRSIKVLEGES